MIQTNAHTADQYLAIRSWLYFVAVLTVVMILVGGATRLTDSGLSITQWNLILGFVPPVNLSDWQAEFLLYQTTDEFKYVNSSMTLEQFKTIYWWEWGHRFLGRLIGLSVVVPMVMFWMRGRLSPWLKRATLGLFILVCLQGALGWWMVISGLKDRVDVSQIRLAMHLTLACVFLAATLWVARTLAHHTADRLEAGFQQAGWLVALILVQIFAGGLVAGLDAGMAYNTWPDMNGTMIPNGIWAATPWWANLTDNAVTVQFVHRVTAYLVWLAVLAHAAYLTFSAPASAHMRRAWLLVALISAQAAVGIITLLLQVPILWALLHQFGAALLVAFATVHWRALNPVSGSVGVSMHPLPKSAHGEI